MLYGRVAERAAIDALLDKAVQGCGGCLVLRGEPGIGKTRLLQYAAEQASEMQASEMQAGEIQILRTAGVEPESDLGYATLHRLLQPLLGRIDVLPEPQARALGVVFGLFSGPPPDRFLVGLATLSLLSEVDRPVLCLVDDAHWADAASMDALAFVARRVAAEPVAIMLAARADIGRTPDVAGLIELRLAGLDEEAAVALLAERDGMTAAERAELLRATGGNPLAIRELPVPSGSGEPVPLEAGLQQAFLERVRHLDAETQHQWLLAAADGKASEAFDHPLVRSAVYYGASPAQRRAAHQALAQALTSPADRDRRAWHLGQAAAGPDESVAAELEVSAGSAAALERAAELSESARGQARRYVAAAARRWHGGDPARARQDLDSAERLRSDDRDVRLDIIGLRALMELRAGVPSDALALLLPVLPELPRTDLPRANGLLMLFGEASFHANASQAWAAIADLGEQLAGDGDTDDAVLSRLFRAVSRVRDGRATALQPTDLAAVAEIDDPVRLAWAGGMAWGLGDRELGRRLRQQAVRRARSLGAIGVLAWALDYAVADELARGRLASAEAAAEKGYRFALEAGQPNTACLHQASLATLAALTGREQRTRELADELLSQASARGLAGASMSARRALALLDLAAGRPAAALEHLELRGEGHPGMVLYAVPELVEASVRAGQPDRATGAYERYQTWAQASDSAELRATAARCAALLKNSEQDYEAALKWHAQSESLIETARTELLFGEYLRRERRRSDARGHLRAAEEIFHRLGASQWAARAAEELRATGATVPRRGPGPSVELTPQERRIVDGVRDGATNREIAAQLFLSPRTVDYHLRKVFQKAGITSRAELIRLEQARD
jgi:DNA-binding CsgD family transcriptional regulator